MIGNYFFSSSGAAAYEIEQSLRFDGSSYFNRNYSSAGNRKTFTISVWVKRAQGGNSFTNERMFGAYDGGGSQFTFGFYGNGAQTELHYDQGYTGPGSGYAYTNAQYRDNSAWYHLVYVADYSNSTAADRWRFYVNGERITSFRETSAVVNGNASWNYQGNHYIGRLASSNTNHFKGYMAELHILDGTAVTNADDFGETNAQGVWVPKEVSGVTYGTNGAYLKFDPSATNGIGHDHSGNGNNWTASGFVVSGTGTDVMSDTPTSNYCTLNPLVVNNSTYLAAAGLSEGNLVANHSTVTYNAFCAGTFKLPSSGKWYWEVKQNAAPTSVYMGIGRTPWNPTTDSGVPNGMYAYKFDGDKIKLGTSSSYGSSWTNGDIIGIAVDMDNTTISFYKNGTSQGNAFTDIDTDYDYVPMTYANDPNRNIWIYNFGQRAFEYTVPSGYKALNTSNLPAPDIADPATAFDLVTYQGTGTTNTLTVDFSPNFAWIKRYDGTGNNILVDTLRGATPPARLFSDSSVGENNASDGVNSFSSTGVVLDGTGGGGGDVNQTSRFYWAAQWDGNGTGSSNTAGSITSTVSANPTAGFSIVGYSGGSTGSTVGHGLGVAPEMIIVKNRDSSTDWMVWLDGFASNQGLNLNNADGRFSSGSNTFIYDVTSTTFKIGSSSIVNAGSEDFIAYCFAGVEGFSKIGTYEGNGSSTDGPFVYLGFKPKFIIIKGMDSGSRQWNIMNSERIPYNGTYARTVAESNLSESAMADSAAAIDILSNGFKVLANSSATNASGETYMYYAVAENPFGGEGVSPATAR